MKEIQLRHNIDVYKVKNIADKNKRLFNLYELFSEKVDLKTIYDILDNSRYDNNLLYIEVQFMISNFEYKRYSIPCLFFHINSRFDFMPLYYDLFIDMVNNLHIDYPFVFNVSKYKFNDCVNSHNYIDHIIEVQNEYQSIGMSFDDFYNSLTCMYRNIN